MLPGILIISDNYLSVAQKGLNLLWFRDLCAEIKYLIWLLKDKYKIWVLRNFSSNCYSNFMVKEERGVRKEK